MPLNWFRNYAGVRKDGVVRAAYEAIANWDPEGASEADLRTRENQLDEMGRRVSVARERLAKEKGEADDYRGRFAKNLAAVDLLKARLEAADDAGKPAISAALDKLVTTTMELRDQTKLEIQDETDAQAVLDEAMAAYELLGAKIRTAKQNLERGRREMERSQNRRDAAAERAESARVAAGLTKVNDGVNVALDAMKRAAERADAEAKTLDDKARVLKPVDALKDDPLIAEALSQASGAKPTANLDDRIKALAL